MAVYDRPSTRFNRLLLGDNTRPQSRAAEAIRPREAGLRFPRQPIAPTPSYGLSPMMQGIAQRSAVPYMSPLAQAMRQTQAQAPTPTPPAPDGTFMQKMSSPQGRALAAAGLTGLQLGGYQDRPVSLGQGIAQIGAAAMGAYDQAQAAKAAADAAAFDRQYKATDLAIRGRAKPTKPLMKMLPVEGGTQLTMLDPETGAVLGKVGGVKPYSGTQVSVDADGNITFSQGTSDIQKGTRKDLEKDVLTLTGQIAMLDQAAANYDPSLLTYGAELESMLGTTISKINPDALPNAQRKKFNKRIAFMRGVQQTFSTLLNDLSGAAVSAFELKNAKKYTINPSDSPIEFESKLRDQTGFAKAALYRAQKILGGESITSDLSRKYPISISGEDSNGHVRILYMHEFVEKYMNNNDVSQADAVEAYAEMAKKG